MQTSWTHVLYTGVPTAVTPDSLVSFLHDHEAIIALSPLVTGWQKAASSDGVRHDYNVTEDVSVLPKGLWKKTISFVATYEDRENGVWSEIHAALGFVSEALYEVVQVANEDVAAVVDEKGHRIEASWVLKETIKSSCNILFKSFVNASMVPTRRTMAHKMMMHLLEQSQQSANDKRDSS